MIPKNKYRITFKPELLDHQDLMVYHSNMLVQAPSSGIQTIYVPCVPGEELAGKWSSEDISISSSDLMAVLKDERSGNTYKIEFFSDQTWIVHRIPQGKYTVVAHNRNGDLLKISSKHMDIPIKGTERELTLHFETT